MKSLEERQAERRARAKESQTGNVTASRDDLQNQAETNVALVDKANGVKSAPLSEAAKREKKANSTKTAVPKNETPEAKAAREAGGGAAPGTTAANPFAAKAK